jgi:hypothetical protein
LGVERIEAFLHRGSGVAGVDEERHELVPQVPLLVFPALNGETSSGPVECVASAAGVGEDLDDLLVVVRGAEALGADGDDLVGVTAGPGEAEHRVRDVEPVGQVVAVARGWECVVTGLHEPAVLGQTFFTQHLRVRRCGAPERVELCVQIEADEPAGERDRVGSGLGAGPEVQVLDLP